MNKNAIHCMVCLLLLIAISISLPVHAQNDQKCTRFFSIFARGSGDSIEEGAAWKEYDSQLESKIQDIQNIMLSVQLGETGSQGSKYPAISVDPWQHPDTLFGAWFSQGQLYEYGKSVDAGVNELTTYLKSQHSECPDSQFVLGGYSQGAQVVGQALSVIPKDIRDKIIFAALFGDPKLNLPEGRGLIPPACRYEQYSPYRREVPDCNTDNGSLGAREPYLPEDMKNKVGLWCNDNDLVCGSSKVLWINDGHGKYAESGGAIDKAVEEIAQKINKPTKHPTIFSMFDGVLPKAPDVMLVVDNSTNMTPSYYNSFVKPVTSLIAKTTVMGGGRVGLETYAGCNQRSGSKNNFTHPTSNIDVVLTKISSTGFYPPACDTTLDLANTIKHAKEYADWNSGAPHIIIAITSSPFSTYATTTSTYSTDNAATFLLAPQNTAQTYSGKKINNADIVALNSEDFDTVLNDANKPYLRAVIDGSNVDTPPGTELHFTANQTIVENDFIIGYDWDYTGDGVYETTTQEPKMTYTYTSPFTGLLALRVRTLTGLEQVVTKKINIGYKAPKIIPKAPVNLSGRMTSDTTALFEWQPGDTLADTWMLSIDDMPLGRVAGSQNYINISDIRKNQRLLFTVKAVTKDWDYGEPASITLVADGSTATQTQNSSPLLSKIAEPVKNELARLGEIFSNHAFGMHFKQDGTSPATPLNLADSHPTASSNNSLFFIGGSILTVVIGIIIAAIVHRNYKHSNIRE